MKLTNKLLIVFSLLTAGMDGIGIASGQLADFDDHWSDKFDNNFIIEINNPSDLVLYNHPVIIDFSDITTEISDFNSENFVLINDSGDSIPIPAQVDDTNEDAKPDELVFVYTIPAKSKLKLYCYYTSEGKQGITFPPKTDAHENWTPQQREIGWESNWCGYSYFEGKMDFYAKRQEGLQMKRFLKETNYHKLNDWGMDVLIIDNKSGIGGVTIWNNDTPVLTVGKSKNTGIRFYRKILSTGPVRSLVRVKMDSIFSGDKLYSVTLNMSAFADNKFSRQDILINTDGSDTVVFSPGIQKLTSDCWRINTGNGTFASWGKMDELIGQIGLGLVFHPEQYAGYFENEKDRLVKLKTPTDQKSTYFVIGGWEKQPYLQTENIENIWINEIENLSRRLQTQLSVQIKTE